MNRDDIIRMAWEARLGSALTHGSERRIWIEGADWHDEIERFAALVAAAEREACASLCERLPAQQRIDVRDECAAAIRARGEK